MPIIWSRFPTVFARRVALVVTLFVTAGGWPAAAQTPQAGGSTAQAAERLARVRAALFSGTAKPDAAVSELKDILASAPDSAEAHALLGIAYRTMGTPEVIGEAIAELRQALALDSKLAPARYYLANIYLELGRTERAREELQTAIEQLPGNAQFLTLLAEVERQLKNPGRSLELLEQALTTDPSSAQAHYYRGLALLDLGRSPEAIAELEGVVKRGEKRAEVYLSLGAAYLDAGRIDDGLEILSQATHINPAGPEIRLQLARAYRLKGQLVNADAQLALAAPAGNASVASPFAQQRQLEYLRYQELGLLRMRQGRLDAAAAAFLKVLEIDPGHGPTNRDLAEIYVRQARYTRAVEYAARAAKLGFPLPAERQKALDAGLAKQKKEGAGVL
jgi:tetratricopeptide (TPR) repeat protein